MHAHTLLLTQRWMYEELKVDIGGDFFIGGNVDAYRLREEMNRLGQGGWELVSSFATNMAQGMSRHILLLFKRPAP